MKNIFYIQYHIDTLSYRSFVFNRSQYSYQHLYRAKVHYHTAISR